MTLPLVAPSNTKPFDSTLFDIYYTPTTRLFQVSLPIIKTNPLGNVTIQNPRWGNTVFVGDAALGVPLEAGAGRRGRRSLRLSRNRIITLWTVIDEQVGSR